MSSSSLGPQAVVTQAGAGEENGAFGLRRRFHVTPDDTGGTFAAWVEEIPDGIGPPLHIHHDAQELFCVVEGRVRFRCSDREAEIGPGGTVLIPRGAKHAFRGVGPGTSRVLVTLTPGRGIGFFREVESEGLSPERDMDRILEIAREYDLEFVGPPL